MWSDEKIKAQDFAVRVLKGHLEKNHIAHTYLFTGDGDSGKEDLALAFASALNCERKKYFLSCDCPPCHKIQSGNHPDVGWLGRDPKVRSIKIEEVRGMMETASLKPYEGQWKVFILVDAERLTADAANAILKTLEEPPAHTLFLLLVKNKAHLLETIQSRSFEVRLKSLQTVDFEKAPDPRAIRERNWFEFFDGFQSTPREELKELLDQLMQEFREAISSAAKAGTDPVWPADALLQGIDSLYETKEALDANANQKLALTRLTLQLYQLAAPPAGHASRSPSSFR